MIERDTIFLNIVLYIRIGYGMSLGFPTIVIPSIQGGDGRDDRADDDFWLTKEQISWFSKLKQCNTKRAFKSMILYAILFLQVPLICYVFQLAVYFLEYSQKL